MSTDEKPATPRRKSTLLGSMSTQTLSEVQATTKSIARKVNSENHKQKKPTIIPEEFTEGGTLPVRIFDPLHHLLKQYAVSTRSDLQTCANEAIYAMLLKKGLIKKSDQA